MRPAPQRQARAKKGFAPAAFRWRVERTFAWLGQCRLLSKDYEKTVASAEAWIWCAMMRLLVRRLA
jgi:putative transposase